LKNSIAEHKQRLADYIKDPDAHDPKGFLETASPELRQKIINTRIRSLEHQIKTFEKDLKNLYEE
jgi:hypothetical protein